jgi:hypothetical protein
MTRPGTPGLWTHDKVWLHQVSSPDAITPSRNLAVGESGLRSTYAPGSSAFLAELRAGAIVVATLHGLHEEALEEAKSRRREERSAAPPPATRIIQLCPSDASARTASGNQPPSATTEGPVAWPEVNRNCGVTLPRAARRLAQCRLQLEARRPHRTPDRGRHPLRGRELGADRPFPPPGCPGRDRR